MSTKKDLAASAGTPAQPPLRRGRGLRLSRAAKEAAGTLPEKRARNEPSKQAASAVPQATVRAAHSGDVDVAQPKAAEPEALALAPPEPAEAAQPLSLGPIREKRKLKLRKDLLKQGKQIARAQDRKLYQVIESALGEYIQRHGVAE